MSGPLVSILIPAYNAAETVAGAIESALAQTWPNKEIIVIDDGSTDKTPKIARTFVPRVTVVSTENRGLSAAVNHAYKLCSGEYIQELDADDLLLPDKIERQLAVLGKGDSKRILLSSPWAPFYYRISTPPRFVRNSFWEDLTPAEWLFRKMRDGAHMQNATWLVSRELAEAAGPWNESLQYDQDGEYFARVLVVSEGTRFVPETGVFYRISGANRISYIGNSNRKKDSLFRSMQLHMQYLRSLEESERVHNACIFYMQTWYDTFYPSRMEIAVELNELAARLGGRLEEPRVSTKYAWMEPLIGHKTTKRLQAMSPQLKLAGLRSYDRLMWWLQTTRKTRPS